MFFLQVGSLRMRQIRADGAARCAIVTEMDKYGANFVDAGGETKPLDLACYKKDEGHEPLDESKYWSSATGGTATVRLQ